MLEDVYCHGVTTEITFDGMLYMLTIYAVIWLWQCVVCTRRSKILVVHCDCGLVSFTHDCHKQL